VWGGNRASVKNAAAVPSEAPARGDCDAARVFLFENLTGKMKRGVSALHPLAGTYALDDAAEHRGHVLS